MTFATKYGPWALVAGASDGVGAAFAKGLAERGVNVVLLARRQAALDQVAAQIKSETSAQTRTLAVDLAQPGAGSTIAAATGDLEIGFLVYCAGADPNYEPFLANPIDAAEAMVQRNCMVPMQLCHHFAPAMVQRGSGGIVILGSGAGLAGGPNMVAYGASVDDVIAEAFENLTNGPTWMAGDAIRGAAQMLASLTRKQAVELFTAAAAAAMGPGK